MKTISNLPADLRGKKIVVSRAQLDISLKFGLWKDYTTWLDPAEQLTFWHNQSVLDQCKLTVQVFLGNEMIFDRVLNSFGTINIQHIFEDIERENCDLKIKILNFESLPIRDDTGVFVSGMIQIESIKLQDIDVTHLLSDHLFGNNAEIDLPMASPVYTWMVENWPTILTPRLNLPIIDIEKYNRKNLFFR